jgi:hypothetical protein
MMLCSLGCCPEEVTAQLLGRGSAPVVQSGEGGAKPKEAAHRDVDYMLNRQQIQGRTLKQ